MRGEKHWYYTSLLVLEGAERGNYHRRDKHNPRTDAGRIGRALFGAPPPLP